MNTDERLTRLEGWVQRYEDTMRGRPSVFVPLQAPLTSTSFDGDSFSTTSDTMIDMLSTFALPSSAKVILCRATIRDSGSAANDCIFYLGPVSGGSYVTVSCSGLANDAWMRSLMVVPCDSGGNVYYKVQASGSSTMDIVLQIWGYWI